MGGREFLEGVKIRRIIPERNKETEHNLSLQLERLRKSKASMLVKIESLTCGIGRAEARELREQNLSVRERE